MIPRENLKFLGRARRQSQHRRPSRLVNCNCRAKRGGNGAPACGKMSNRVILNYIAPPPPGHSVEHTIPRRRKRGSERPQRDAMRLLNLRCMLSNLLQSLAILSSSCARTDLCGRKTLPCLGGSIVTHQPPLIPPDHFSRVNRTVGWARPPNGNRP